MPVSHLVEVEVVRVLEEQGEGLHESDNQSNDAKLFGTRPEGKPGAQPMVMI